MHPSEPDEMPPLKPGNGHEFMACYLTLMPSPSRSNNDNNQTVINLRHANGFKPMNVSDVTIGIVAREGSGQNQSSEKAPPVCLEVEGKVATGCVRRRKVTFKMFDPIRISQSWHQEGRRIVEEVMKRSRSLRVGLIRCKPNGEATLYAWASRAHPSLQELVRVKLTPLKFNKTDSTRDPAMTDLMNVLEKNYDKKTYDFVVVAAEVKNINTFVDTLGQLMRKCSGASAPSHQPIKIFGTTRDFPDPAWIFDFFESSEFRSYCVQFESERQNRLLQVLKNLSPSRDASILCHEEKQIRNAADAHAVDYLLIHWNYIKNIPGSERPVRIAELLQIFDAVEDGKGKVELLSTDTPFSDSFPGPIDIMAILYPGQLASTYNYE